MRLIKHGNMRVIPDHIYVALIKRRSLLKKNTSLKGKKLKQRYSVVSTEYTPYNLEHSGSILKVITGPLAGTYLLPELGSYKFFDQMNKLSEVFSVDSLISFTGENAR